MSYAIAINENEFVNVFGHKIRSGAESEKQFEVQHVKFPVNLGDATIYESFNEAFDILKQIKHRKKYIKMYGWNLFGVDSELWKFIDNMYIACVFTSNVKEEMGIDMATKLESMYRNKLKDYENFKERYNVLFRSINPESPFETLPQYALDRNEFVRIYGNISEVLMNESWYETSDFKGWYNDDEWYILHKHSGTLINWYKHCGRTNTCNKVLTIKQHEQFAKMILKDMKDNNIGAN